MKKSLTGKVKAVTVLGFLLLIALIIKMLLRERFDSVEQLQNYMKGMGVFAPVVLTAVQAMQVVVPVLPGYLGCVAGAVAFGSATGFWCNYLGICAGSIAAYFLAEKYGAVFVKEMFSECFYEKWRQKIEAGKSYKIFLFVATLLPLFPDDFLCYFSGLIRMDRKAFIWIILLGKPWCILAYSILSGMVK